MKYKIEDFEEDDQVVVLGYPETWSCVHGGKYPGYLSEKMNLKFPYYGKVNKVGGYNFDISKYYPILIGDYGFELNSLIEKNMIIKCEISELSESYKDSKLKEFLENS